ncbi:MAG: hypothetical protein H7Y31_08040 [Chitinophagaceae bacterium]|nr:hypothetical protein [Chitinophagaceae bacterium]
MKRLLFFMCAVGSLMITSCANNPTTESMNGDIASELKLIDSALRSKEYSTSFSLALNNAYGGDTAASKKDSGETISKSFKHEKIAINLAGFYALECAIGFLGEKEPSKTPIDLLTIIVEDKADSATQDILNRFANATWKASQPFRGMDRIQRYNFHPFNFLTASEVQKDYQQIKSAATKLLQAIRTDSASSKSAQVNRIKELLQSDEFALEMASFLDSSYAANMRQAITPFLTAGQDTITIRKSKSEEEIAVSLAGFYALECGVNYLVVSKGLAPSKICEMIIEGKLDATDKSLFNRFANATWKTGQPFRSFERIHRSMFIPYDLLSAGVKDQDAQQIEAAAKQLLKMLQSGQL